MKTTTAKYERQLADLMKMLKAKDEQISQLSTRVETLETAVNNLEQHSKKKNVIVTGLNLHSFAHTAASRPNTRTTTPAEQSTGETATMKQKFITFAHDNLHVDIPEMEITAIHDLPQRRDGTTPIIVQFLTTEKRTEVMQNRKSLKGTNVYLNDHLSRLNNELFHHARTLRRDKKIHSTWTTNSIIYVKKTETSSPIQIRGQADFNKL